MEYRNAIIIEGPDCSGKTTLANKLREYFDYVPDVVHCTGHDPRDYEFYFQTMRKKNVIFDRQFVGEMVYPTVFNRKAALTDEEFTKLINNVVETRIPVLIVCPPKEVLINRLLTERPDEEKEIVNTITYARDKFYELAKSHKEFILVEPGLDGEVDFKYVISEIERVFNGE